MLRGPFAYVRSRRQAKKKKKYIQLQAEQGCMTSASTVLEGEVQRV
jgi:hypothetical protein